MKKENKTKDENLKEQEKLLCPKAGTATSSRVHNTASQSNMNIVNVMLWMKKNAYADTTIKATAKRLRHFKKYCDLSKPEKLVNLKEG